MSHSMRLRVRLIVLGLAVCAGWAAARDEAVKGLQYRFKAGETYIYTVKIVGEIGSSTETTTGQIQLTGKSATADQMQLTPKVVLKTQAPRPVGKGKAKGKIGRPAMPGFFGKGKGRAAAPDLIVDPSGKILKLTGETALPLLLGTAEQLVVEPLSTGMNRWKKDRDVIIVGSNDSRTSAKEEVSYEVVSSAGSTIKIKKTYDLKTVAKGTEPPRLQLNGTSDIVFDAEAGVIKSGEFKGAITITERTVTGRIPITATYRLMTAAEVETIKKEAEAARIKREEAAKEAAKPKPISAAELNKAIADVKGGGFKVAQGADRLAKALPIESRRQEVVAALTAAAKSTESGFLKPAAAKALKTWATDKEVPTFIDLLQDKNVWVRKTAFEALGELKDAKGAEAVAQKMRDFFARGDAIASLKTMGKAAEKAVRPLLKDSDGGVRKEACKLLGEIGTRESLPALKAAQKDSNRLVAGEAAKAVKAIEGR